MRSQVHKNETQSDRDRQDKIPGGTSRNKSQAACLFQKIALSMHPEQQTEASVFIGYSLWTADF